MIDLRHIFRRLSERATALLMNGKRGFDMPWRGFDFPLNVFMYILTKEEAEIAYLHYGLFETGGESIGLAQERATEMLLERIPPPPLRLLEVGVGLGTLLARLRLAGYEAEGITPDENQVAMIRATHGAALPVFCVPFEKLEGRGPYDLLLFQESSQYINPHTLFAQASSLAPLVLVLDEFAARPLSFNGALTPLEEFLRAATLYGYSVAEEVDLSARAAPTVDYFIERLPYYREALVEELHLPPAKIEELLASGLRYRQLYREGLYVYRLLQFRR